ncbi:BCCT-family transporter [Escherichia coli]|uniref:BCCT-family transporter n=1 Tax=Escherichia coli TaxID=562 RepID=A0A2X3K834_ECOLX|nr:BCCT-family transporter [Escherichia coli]
MDFSALTGLPDNFTVQAFVILLSGGIFCLSSWIGINNGLQRLSKMVGWGAFLLPLLVLIGRPNRIYYQQHHQCIGLTTQNFLQMSLFTIRLAMVHLPQLDRFLLAVVDLIHPWRSNVSHPRFPRS